MSNDRVFFPQPSSHAGAEIMSDFKLRMGPISYELYTLFLNYLIRKKNPDDNVLKNTEALMLARNACSAPLQSDESQQRADGGNSEPDNVLSKFKSHQLSDIDIDQKSGDYPTKAVRPLATQDFSNPNESRYSSPISSQESRTAGEHVPKPEEAVEANTTAKRSPADRRRRRFLAWARKMYIVEVNMSSAHKDMQIISLMSKKSKKEIVPYESCELLIQKIHSQNNMPGRYHLAIKQTIAVYKTKYTFGRRDFGISECLVRKVIANCPTTHCCGKIFWKDPRPASSSNDQELTLVMNDVRHTVLSHLFDDPFYQDFAKIVIVNEHHDLFKPTPDETKNAEKAAYDVKRAGNPLYQARALKRKLNSSERVAGADGAATVTNVPQFNNPAAAMGFVEAYGCLVETVRRMRREYLCACNGERRHYDSLSRSITAASVLLRRCRRQHMVRAATVSHSEESATAESQPRRRVPE